MWGVVSMCYNRIIESTKNLWRGLHCGRCSVFPADQQMTGTPGSSVVFNKGESRCSSKLSGPDGTEETTSSFKDRSLTCIVPYPARRPLRMFTSALELLQVLRDAIKAHRSLFQDAQNLHQDISAENIIIAKARHEGEPMGFYDRPPRGLGAGYWSENGWRSDRHTAIHGHRNSETQTSHVSARLGVVSLRHLVDCCGKRVAEPPEDQSAQAVIEGNLGRVGGKQSLRYGEQWLYQHHS